MPQSLQAQRLEKARLQLIVAENNLGLASQQSRNGKVWHVDGSNQQLLQVLADLIDGFDVTVCGNIFLNNREQTRIAAKVRKRKNLLLTLQPWVGISRNWSFETAWKQVG